MGVTFQKYDSDNKSFTPRKIVAVGKGGGSAGSGTSIDMGGQDITTRNYSQIDMEDGCDN